MGLFWFVFSLIHSAVIYEILSLYFKEKKSYLKPGNTHFAKYFWMYAEAYNIVNQLYFDKINLMFDGKQQNSVKLLVSSQCISLSCQSMDSLATDSVLVTNIFVEQ